MIRPLHHFVRLSEDERKELELLVCQGRNSARVLRRARILLLADRSAAGPKLSDLQISEALCVSVWIV